MKNASARLLLISLCWLAACIPTSGPPQSPEADMSFQLSSPAFAAGKPIPADYSCRGSNASPTLTWTDPPAGTQAFALIMDDPDAPAGTWVHWVLYNLPASARGLPQAVPNGASGPEGSLQGKNSSGHLGYDGPCPPSGTHRYFFRLYALDGALSLPSGAGKPQVLAVIQGHTLGTAELMGTFSH